VINLIKRHTAIFSEGSYEFHYNLLDVAPSKKIAVLCFHTAERISKTKMEFKRIRNQASNQIQAMSDNLTTWSIIHLLSVSYHAQMPALYQDVSNLS